MAGKEHIVKILSVVAMVTLAMGAVGCGSQDAASTSTNNGNQVSIWYLQKRGDQTWYQLQGKGAEQAGKDLGVDVRVLDSHFDPNTYVNNLTTSTNSNVSGLIVSQPDVNLSPRTLQLTNNGTKPPVITLDDPVNDSSGKNAVSFVGGDWPNAGTLVGQELGTLYKQGNWDPKTTGVAALTFNVLDVCRVRTENARKELVSAAPQLGNHVFETNYKNADVQGGLDAMSALITGHPDIKHWLVYACNTDGVAGAVQALDTNNLAKDSAAVGLGEGMTEKQEFEKHEPAFKAFVFVNAFEEGYNAVKELVDKIKNGTEVPKETLVKGVIVTPDTFNKTVGPVTGNLSQ